MNEYFSKRAREIIEKIIYITIATVCESGSPWNTPVYSSYDESYTYYWISSQDSVHSKNIKRTGKAFLVIYDSTVMEGTGEGVYIETRALEVDDEAEIVRAMRHHYGRKGKLPRDASDFMGTSPRRFYKAIPGRVWINTDEKIDGHHVDTRVEVKLTSR